MKKYLRTGPVLTIILEITKTMGCLRTQTQVNPDSRV